jgi:DNA-binding MarR family transcriptional regulator
VEDVHSTNFGSRPSSFRDPQVHLGFKLWQVGRTFVEALTVELITEGFDDLTPGLVNIMPMLDVTGTQISALAARLNISKQAAAKIVQRLVILGYVTLTERPDDRRARLVNFSERGLALLEAGERQKIALEKKLLKDIPADDQSRFLTVLKRILENADNTARI